MQNKTTLIFLSVLFMSSFALSVSAEDIGYAFNKSYEAEAKGSLDEAYKRIQFVADQAADAGLGYLVKVRLGYLDNLMGKYKESATLYEEAAEMKPGAVEPLLNLENQYFLLKDWKNLAESSGRALQIDPKNYTSKTRLALAHFSMGNYSLSIKEYSEVLELYPCDLEVKDKLGWAYIFSKNKEKATRIFKEILSVNPSRKTAQDGIDYISKNL